MTFTKTKKRKVSKKTKKAWRKHVDVKDVDVFLDNSRQEERLGSFSDRKDSELFVVSTEPEHLPKKVRRELLKKKEPRCFEILKTRSAVPDPIAKRNRVRTKEERKNLLVVQKETARKLQGILKLKEKVALKNRTIAEKTRLNRPKRGEFNVDVWQESEKEVDTTWMTSDTKRHALAHFGKTKKKLPTALQKKPSVIPAIETPHPGTSYNPSFEDHQSLLRDVAEKEMELMKQEAHLERVTTHMFKKVSPEEKERNTLKEMSEGLKLGDAEEEQEESDVDDDPTVRSVNPPVKIAKKTRVQRRKQKEQKELEKQKQHLKVEKKKISDIYKLKLLDKQLAAKDRKENVLRTKRLKKKMIEQADTKTLSKVKFQPAEPDFKLSEELAGNLRSSAPAGNLLRDRFKSLQQRNIVAPSTLQLKSKKAKVKRFTKADHKIDPSKLQESNFRV